MITCDDLEIMHIERDDQVQRGGPSGRLEMPGSLSKRDSLSHMYRYRCVTSPDPHHALTGHNAVACRLRSNFFRATTFALIYRAATLKGKRKEVMWPKGCLYLCI